MYTVIITFYSLEMNRVGMPIDKAAIVRKHPTARAALLDLYASICTDEGRKMGSLEGTSKMIVMPDGRRLAFNAVYTETFGESPVPYDNNDDGYPRLFSRAKQLAIHRR